MEVLLQSKTDMLDSGSGASYSSMFILRDMRKGIEGCETTAFNILQDV